MSLLKDLIEEDFGLVRQGERWYRAVEHDSLVYDEKSDYFFWNSRGIGGGVLEYLTLVRGVSKKEAIRQLRSMFHERSSDIISSNQEVSTSDFMARKFNEILNKNKKCREYFYSRGIFDDVISRYNLGCYKMGYIFYTIPLYNSSGELRNIQIRTETTEERPKIVFKYYKLGEASIWNEKVLNSVKEVYFTEGLVDAILLSTVGAPVISTDSGISVSSYVLDTLNKFNISRIYIIQDNDKAGMSEATRFANKFGWERTKIFSWEMFDKLYGYKSDVKFDVVDVYQKYGINAVSSMLSRDLFV